MNNPNPFVPQGSMLEQKNRSRARLRTAFFCVLAINIIPITLALLMQGCRKPAETEPQVDTNPVVAPFEPTNTPPVETMPADTNATGVQPPAEPTTVATTPAVPPAAAVEYTVAKGDTFTTIAKKFGVTTKAIQEANPSVVPTKLQIGQKLQIPPPLAAATPSASAAASQPGAAGGQTYKVKSGDTLTKIAKDHGTTVNALRSENNLTTDRIKVGQELKIPAQATPPAAPAPSVVAPAGTNQPM